MSIPRNDQAVIDAGLAITKARIQAASGRLSNLVLGKTSEEIERILNVEFEQILAEEEAAMLTRLGITK